MLESTVVQHTFCVNDVTRHVCRIVRSNAIKSLLFLETTRPPVEDRNSKPMVSTSSGKGQLAAAYASVRASDRKR